VWKGLDWIYLAQDRVQWQDDVSSSYYIASNDTIMHNYCIGKNVEEVVVAKFELLSLAFVWRH
jgi:hypothetical protein